MSTPQKTFREDASSPAGGSSSRDPNPPTVAAFSPPTLARSDPTSLRQRSTILVHQKSPLLVATPPQVTRTLAYSYPFIQPLNKIAGLLSWTSGDPWESFLLLAGFWAITLYGDPVLRWGGPIVVVILLILGMYSRRFSTLSSTATSGEKSAKGHSRTQSEAIRNAKSLDEIVDNLKLFTSRCNILLDPFLRLTDFLSTQRTATSATTRPALTAMFVRISLVTPIWILLTLPPIYVVTTKRLILFIGTVTLTWHSRPARVTRTILWRSRHIRRATSILTGLQLAEPHDAENGNGKPPLPPRTNKTANDIAASLKKRRPSSPGIRFTFTLYENQRRWLLLGWTSSMLAYERAPWTDEHLNAMPSKDAFELPEVEGGHARWRWVEDSEWHIDQGDPKSRKKSSSDDEDDGEGWIYYDSKWKDGRRGADSWGRYTRRRKWLRDAELVENTPSTEVTPSRTPIAEQSDAEDTSTPNSPSKNLAESTATIVPPSSNGSTAVDDDTTSTTGSASAQKKGRWFRRRASSKADSQHSVGVATGSNVSVGSSSLKSYPDEEDEYRPSLYYQERGKESWSYGDDIGMQLG
jgi:hypothetical protein